MTANPGTVSGGAKLDKFLAEAGKVLKKGGRSVSVGFFETARYQDRTLVAMVAAIHEFGLGHQKERAFFRKALNGGAVDDAKKILEDNIDKGTLAVSPQVPDLIGLAVSDLVKASITQVKQQDGALIDTGFMRQSVTWAVNDKPPEKAE